MLSNEEEAIVASGSIELEASRCISFLDFHLAIPFVPNKRCSVQSEALKEALKSYLWHPVLIEKDASDAVEMPDIDRHINTTTTMAKSGSKMILKMTLDKLSMGCSDYLYSKFSLVYRYVDGTKTPSENFLQDTDLPSKEDLPRFKVRQNKTWRQHF